MTHERTVSETTSSSKVKPREVKKRKKKSGTKKAPTRAGANVVDIAAKNKFSQGMLVEVSSDEDGFEGAWFAATIVDAVGKDKYLVQYQSLRMEDDADFLREEIDILHIRPSPPETLVLDCFKLMEEVDALYNDAWWVGVVTKVHHDSRYTVYFKDTKEELIFEHTDLRPHQDFINGKWVMPSKVLRLCFAKEA
uniref:Uncharacterized protein MANES_09G178400 n=1 Tax=Rhizophora mucronata TaxID=61149 RepID=A0A2P2M7H0_RHIMU